MERALSSKKERWRRVKHLVVLDFPSVHILSFVSPSKVLRYGKERETLLAMRCLNDGSDKLLEKAMTEKGRPEVVDEIDHQALDVRAIVILICH